MRKIVKQSIDRQIAAFTDAGYPPAVILLSRDMYTKFLQELAYDRATDEIEPIKEYEGILVVIAPGEEIATVAPNAEIHWNNAAEIDGISSPAERQVPVRFMEI